MLAGLRCIGHSKALLHSVIIAIVGLAMVPPRHKVPIGHLKNLEGSKAVISDGPTCLLKRFVGSVGFVGIEVDNFKGGVHVNNSTLLPYGSQVYNSPSMTTKRTR